MTHRRHARSRIFSAAIAVLVSSALVGTSASVAWAQSLAPAESATSTSVTTAEMPRDVEPAPAVESDAVADAAQPLAESSISVPSAQVPSTEVPTAQVPSTEVSSVPVPSTPAPPVAQTPAEQALTEQTPAEQAPTEQTPTEQDAGVNRLPAKAERQVDAAVSGPVFQAAAEAQFSLRGAEPVAVAATTGRAGVITTTGRVVDSVSGAPLAGLVVSHGDGPPGEVTPITTDHDGRFSIDAAGDGWVYLNVASSAASGHLDTWGSLSGATTGSSYDVGTVPVEPGAVLSGTLTVPAASVSTQDVYINAFDASASYSTGWWSGSASSGGSVDWSIVVPAGSYSVQLSDGRTHREQWFDAAQTRAGAKAVTVAVGDRVADIDGVLAFGQNSMSGTVRSASGTPLADVSVSASTSESPYRSYSATTDAQGRYFFGNVDAGNYRIQFYPAPGAGLSTYYGGDSYNTATVISIPTGTTPTVKTGLDGLIKPGASVTGTVPVDARAAITSVGIQSVGGSTSRSVPVDDSGRFRITDAAPGTYEFIYYVGDSRTVWGEPFTLTGAEVHEVDLTGLTAQIAVLTVTVDMPQSGTTASVRVEVLDAATKAVVVERSTNAASPLELRLSPGDYIVRYSNMSAGGSPVYYPGVNSAAQATIVTLTVDAPQSIVLTGGSGKISGAVTTAQSEADAGVRPVGDVRVELYRADQLDSPVATSQTDESGAYAFEGLGVNNYAVRVVGSSQLFVDRWFGPSGERSDATAISLADAGSFASADVELVLGGAITGTFADASLSPNAYVNIYFSPVGGGLSFSIWGQASNVVKDGVWSIRGVPAGDYLISGSLGQVSFARASAVTVSAGEVTEGVDLALPPAQIMGTIRLAATGQPAYALVTATYTQSNEWGSWSSTRNAYTDPSTGQYRLTGIPAGTAVTLHFRPAGSSVNASSQWWEGADTLEEATPVVVGESGSPFIADVDLAPGVLVEGTLVDALSSNPVQGVEVNGSSYSAGDGSFATYFDRSGAVTLTTRAGESHVASSTPLTLPAEGLTGVTVALERGYRITGSVVADNNNAPLAGISLRLTPANDEYGSVNASVSTFSNSAEFKTSAVAPGRYKLQATNYSGLYVQQWYDRVDEFGNAQEIVITDADVAGTDVRMTLGGTVTGRIVDADGNAVSGATVGVATAPDSGAAGLFSRLRSAVAGASQDSPILDIQTSTDENGQFRLPPLEPGDYTLYIYRPGFATTWFDGKSTRAEATVIHVSAGQTFALPQAVELAPLAEGETALTPEQTLSNEFALVADPADQSVNSGEEVVFTAIASGAPVPTVQWQRRDVSSDSWVDIDGATDSRLVLASVSVDDDGAQFRAVFSQGASTIETRAASLTVSRADTVPEAPAAPTVGKTTTTTAALSWTAPADGGSPLTGYRLALFAGGSTVAERTVALGAVTTAEIGGLTPGTDYEVAVTAINAIGEGDASPRAAFSTVALTAPGAPTDVVSTATTDDSFTIGWKVPAATGGTPITGWKVLVSTGGTVVAERSPAASATSMTVDGLAPDTEYSVSVAASNIVGVGSPTTISVRTSEETPADTVPGMPGGVKVTAVTAQSVALSWDAPQTDGGSPITGYLVAVTSKGQPAGSTVALDGRAAVVSGLTAGTDYEFTLSAVNVVGTGAASASISATTSAPDPVVPGAPTGVTVSAASANSLVVSWRPPTADGGSPILGYDVVLTRGGVLVNASVQVTQTGATVDGLEPDTEYSVRVSARNVVGLGAASEPQLVRTLEPAPVITVPAAPGTPVATVNGATAVALTWTAPTSDGGSPITGYVVRTYTDGSTAPVVKNVTGTSTVVSELAPATSYTFTVEAVNVRGSSAASPRSSAVSTPAAVPGAPTKVTATAVATALTVAWEAPASDGGVEIDSYLVEVSAAGDDPVRLTATGTTLTVGGLAPATTYSVTVYAHNSAGTGPGASVTATTPPAPTTSPSPEPTDTQSPEPQPTGPGSEPAQPPAGGGGTQPPLPATGAPSAPQAEQLTQANRGGLIVAPSSVVAGRTVTVQGLTPGASYDAWFFSAPTYAGVVTADAAGRVTVTVPASLPAGSHRLVLTELTTGAIAGWVSVTVFGAGLPVTGAAAPIGMAMGAGALMLGGLACVAITRRRRGVEA